MKTKIEIFSSQKMKNFFTNLAGLFEISFRNLGELDACVNSKNICVVFFDQERAINQKTLKTMSQNQNFIFVSNELSGSEKSYIDLKKGITAPITISKFLDTINEIINKKKHTFSNIDLNNNTATNTNTNQKIYLTEAENLILFKLFNEKTINKKLLEKDVLDIRYDINTSSMESHLNRIRKKLKKIDSNFSVFSKNNNVFLEIINLNK